MSADDPTRLIPLPPALAAVVEDLMVLADVKHREEVDLRCRIANLLREFLGVDTATRLTYLRDERAVQVHLKSAATNDATPEA